MARVRAPRVATRNQTLFAAVGLFLFAVLASYVFGGSLSTLAGVFALGLLALSLVPLSGWGGQVSLCQFTFAGIGALAMHWVDGGSSVLGLLAAAGLCGAFGAVLALPALRLRGIYLALATLGFAVLMDNIFFNAPSIVGAGGIVTVGRPNIFGYDFSSMRSYVILLAAILAAAIVGAGAIRRGRWGRRLTALQDSPVASTTLGAGLVPTKLIVFTGSAALAGVAGALLAGIAGSAGTSQFQFLESIILFVAVTLAGSRLLSSALLAGLALSVLPAISAHLPSAIGDNFEYVLFGAGIIAISRSPNALGALYLRVGDWWRRRHDAHQGGISASTLAPSELVQVDVAPDG